jgi:metal-sulfur cluster biosynthetic enzyme
MDLYMFRVVPLPIIRSPLTVNLALVYFIMFEDSFEAGPARKMSSNRMTYTSAKCRVNGLLMMSRGTARNM